MQSNDLEILVNETVLSLRKLLQVKGGEYAGSDDRLANFKRGGNLTGVDPLTVLFIYMSKHYDAVATYVRKNQAGEKQVLSEPIEGRLDDLINYCILAKAIIKEQSDANPVAIFHGSNHLNTARVPNSTIGAGVARTALRGEDEPSAGRRRDDDVHGDKHRP